MCHWNDNWSPLTTGCYNWAAKLTSDCDFFRIRIFYKVSNCPLAHIPYLIQVQDRKKSDSLQLAQKRNRKPWAVVLFSSEIDPPSNALFLKGLNKKFIFSNIYFKLAPDRSFGQFCSLRKKNLRNIIDKFIFTVTIWKIYRWFVTIQKLPKL